MLFRGSTLTAEWHPTVQREMYLLCVWDGGKSTRATGRRSLVREMGERRNNKDHLFALKLANLFFSFLQ